MTEDLPTTVHPAYAGFWIRAGAEILDEVFLILLVGAIALVIVLPTLILVEVAGRELDSEKYANILAPLIIIPVFWIYRAGFEASRRQATPGKLVMGLKVTDEQGNRLSFGRASVRGLAKILSTMFCNLGFLMVVLNFRRQCLHDVIAKTLVVRSR